MITQPLAVNSHAKHQNTNSLAIFFFMLGLPNVYSVLRQRSQRKAFSTQSLPVKGIGLLTATLAVTLSVLMF